MWNRSVSIGLALLAWFVTSPAAAQSFRGSGPEATETFPLAAGLAVFEVQHRGEGAFLVKLLDANGNVVSEVARGSGSFGGSKSIRIPETGLYLFNVEATGEWNVRLRSNEALPDGFDDPAAARGREAGHADAGKKGTLGWLVRGFVGGALLGPVGTGIVVNRAGNSAAATADEAMRAHSAQEPAYTTAYRQSYMDRLRGRQQRSALIGGAVGTGVLVWAILQAIDLGKTSESDEFEEPPLTIVIPIRW
jgi:hypothetical protein